MLNLCVFFQLEVDIYFYYTNCDTHIFLRQALCKLFKTGNVYNFLFKKLCAFFLRQAVCILFETSDAHTFCDKHVYNFLE